MPVVSPATCASRWIWPASLFVTILVATPLDAVALPSPATVPAPPVFAKATTVELSLVTVLPCASWIAALSV